MQDIVHVLALQAEVSLFGRYMVSIILRPEALLRRGPFGAGPEIKGIAADFRETGVELKQTCIDVRKDGTYTAGERLSVTNISYEEPVEEDFYRSHVWEKIRLILLVHYLRDSVCASGIPMWDRY